MFTIKNGNHLMTMHILFVTIVCIWLIYSILRKKIPTCYLFTTTHPHYKYLLKTYVPVPMLGSRASNSPKTIKTQVEILSS